MLENTKIVMLSLLNMQAIILTLVYFTYRDIPFIFLFIHNYLWHKHTTTPEAAYAICACCAPTELKEEEILKTCTFTLIQRFLWKGLPVMKHYQSLGYKQQWAGELCYWWSKGFWHDVCLLKAPSSHRPCAVCGMSLSTGYGMQGSTVSSEAK